MSQPTFDPNNQTTFDPNAVLHNQMNSLNQSISQNSVPQLPQFSVPQNSVPQNSVPQLPQFSVPQNSVLQNSSYIDPNVQLNNQMNSMNLNNVPQNSQLQYSQGNGMNSSQQMQNVQQSNMNSQKLPSFPQGEPEKPVSKFVNWNKIDASKISCISPTGKNYEKKGSDGKVEKGGYNEIKLFYDYSPDPEKQIKDGIYIQYPKIRSTGLNIKRKDGKDGGFYDEKSMMFTFDNTNKDQVSFARVLRGPVYLKLAEIVNANKNPIGMHDYDLNNPGAGFSQSVYIQMDKNTGKLIDGVSPTQWVKVKFNSSFKGLDKKDIPEQFLVNADIEGYPLIHLSHLYAGGKKASAQFILSSFLVTSITPRSNSNRQEDLFTEITISNPDLVKSYEEQIAKFQELKRIELEKEEQRKKELEEKKKSEEPKTDNSQQNALLNPNNVAPGINQFFQTQQYPNQIPQQMNPGNQFQPQMNSMNMNPGNQFQPQFQSPMNQMIPPQMNSSQMNPMNQSQMNPMNQSQMNQSQMNPMNQQPQNLQNFLTRGQTQ